MAAHNSSAAYDLSAYQPAPKAKQRPELKVVKSTRQAASSAFTFRTFCAFAIVVTLVSLIVYNQVQLNELTGDINKLSEEMKILESEHVKMNSDLESIISLPSVAEQAKNQLGMNRLDKYQTEYVYLYQDDKVVLTDSSPVESWDEQIQYSLKAMIGRLQEYLVG